MDKASDEILDDAGRLRRPWRRMLGSLLGLGIETIRERGTELNRTLSDEGMVTASTLPWRCDPIPFLLTETDFAELARGLSQRATLLDALLADLYGPRDLLRTGVLPSAMVFPNPAYLRPCRVSPPRGQHLHLYAADVLRAADGRWHVLADHTGEPAGLATVLENRRLMARVLPDLFRAVEVAPIRPFMDAWADALARLGPGGPGIALLSSGHDQAAWFEHVVLARALGCALVEAGDLTVRGGALWVKTLRGLSPVHVLLRFRPGCGLDSLELQHESRGGIPGLFEAMREGAVTVVNPPGAGVAEAPALAARLPALCRHMLGEEPLLPGVETIWGADAALPAGEAWEILPAFHPAATGMDQPWTQVARRKPAPSFVPCVGPGEVLDPRGAILRLFLLWDGAAWQILKGGMAVVGDFNAPVPTVKDVWVLEEEGADIIGPPSLPVPSLAIRRTAADLPSRVADNFFWFGRYLERLENAARLTRALLVRLTRAGLLPRDLPELQVLAACLRAVRVVGDEFTVHAGASGMTNILVHALSRDAGTIAWLIGQVQLLADTLRDRLSAEMHATLVHGSRGLKGARLALQTGDKGTRSAGLLADFAGRVLEFSAAVSGYAAENMVAGGGRMFLDLGRRIERGQAIAAQLAHALDQPADRIEAGLNLALELCDSTLTYRRRYLGIVQPAPVLDLVLEDAGNPRSLGFQLCSARSTLAALAEDERAPLPAMLDGPIEESRRIVAEMVAAADQASAAAELPDRLEAIGRVLASVSDVLGRRYFTLLPVQWADAI